jgi:nucleoside-diphosphate-sugar epimerase
MSERVVITGGAGFIGSRLAAAHVAAGDEVLAIVRPRGLVRGRSLPPGVVSARIHLEDSEALEKCMQSARPTIVYHLAGDTGRDAGIPNPSEVHRLTGDLHNLLTLLSAAGEARPSVFIRAGSLAEYGDGPVPSRESQREQPLTPYATAMVAGAHYARMLQPRLRFPVLTARLGLTYGPGQSDAFLVPWLIQRCLAGQSSEVQRPAWRRDLIYVDDVVEGLRALARGNLSGGSIVNLCTGVAPTMSEVAGLIVEATGVTSDLITFGNQAESGNGIAVVQGSPDLASAGLGWTARTSLRDGLQQSAASFGRLAYA